MNTVSSLKSRPFVYLSNGEQLEVKRLGRDKPTFGNASVSGRKFQPSWYERFEWLTACPDLGKAFCFPCLLFGRDMRDQSWTESGINDWKHFIEKATKHAKTKCHVESSVRLVFLGQVNVAEQLSEAHRTVVRKHNMEVDRNRYVLSRIIDCIKFCGAFELALRGHDERTSSENPGVFLGMVDFAASLDSALRDHLETATVFKGTSKTIQNELLDIMYQVACDKIREEVKNAEFVATISDDTSDISGHLQNVLVIRYILNNTVVERFWSFAVLEDSRAHTIAQRVLESIKDIFQGVEDKNKLVAQCYDGASVMRGEEGGVQGIVKRTYPNAHYVHCYAHQLNLIVQQVVSNLSPIRVFFANLSGFSSFFAHSNKRIQVLEHCVNARLPRVVSTRWNFTSRLVQTVYKHREDLAECFRTIISTWKGDGIAIREACGLLHWLEDDNFNLYLSFFNDLMPHIDILYGQLQKVDIDPAFVGNCVEHFVYAINNLRHNVEIYGRRTESQKRIRVDLQEQHRVLREACDIIVSHCNSRFSFRRHLLAANLINSKYFVTYANSFPKKILQEVVQAYPMLDYLQLESELSVLYRRREFQECCGALALLEFIQRNNLETTFEQLAKLLCIVITTPMTSSEAERCFSTLKRLKTFLRNTMAEERLNALAMLSMEKSMIRSWTDFNKTVVEKFCQLKERRAKFLYK